jgi:hypothetical protein
MRGPPLMQRDRNGRAEPVDLVRRDQGVSRAAAQVGERVP